MEEKTNKSAKKQPTISELSGLNSNSESEYKEIVYKRISDTPFTAIQKEKDDEWIITIGNQIATDKVFKSYEECKKYVNKKPWDLIGTLAAVFAKENSKGQ